MNREQLLEQLTDLICQLPAERPQRVAIDGVDCAGKTTLADELAARLAARGRPVIRATLDGFHRPRADRHRRGPESPEGYYRDSFDYDALRAALLLPLGPGGDRCYRLAVFDFQADAPVDAPLQQAPENAILLLDGVFLLRPELNDDWDFRVFLDIDFDVALQRAVERDQKLFGSPEAVQARYWRRYIPAQMTYLQTVQPRQLADVVVENNLPDEPNLLRR
jgi:uridine kinase